VTAQSLAVTPLILILPQLPSGSAFVSEVERRIRFLQKIKQGLQKERENSISAAVKLVLSKVCSGGDKTNEGNGESSGPFRFGAVGGDLSGTFQPFHNRVHRRE
jgi:hypothetical protein